jgi:hypothetical protein
MPRDGRSPAGASNEAMRDVPSLDGVFAKIGRANHHLAELENSLSVALDPNRYHFDRELENGEYVYHVYGVPNVDPTWSLIVGDCLHNLRSALDYLAWQLVLLDNGDPNEETQFPIRETPFNKAGEIQPTQLKPAIRRPEILSALEEAQPYYENGGPQESLLWALSRLNNIDKHRLLLVVACVFVPDHMWWSSEEDDPAPTIRANIGPLKDGDRVAWFDFQGAEPPPGFDPHPTLQVSLLEGRTKHLIGKMSVTNALHGLIYEVEWGVINRWFRGLFPPISVEIG